MIRATVSTPEGEPKTGTAKRTGKPYSIREQAVLLEFQNGERRSFNLTLEDNAPSMEKGIYTPKPSAAYLDGYDLKISARARDWVKAT
jgi:hypothetical protein